MKTTNPHLAIVDREKILSYLLNPGHPDNGGKAQFFMSLGFKTENWEILAGELRKLVISADAIKVMESSHGTKYVVDGLINGPIGETSRVRTVWIVDRGSKAPRLVTAYPSSE